MKKFAYYSVLLILLTLVSVSCVSKESMIMYQNIETYNDTDTQPYKTSVQPDDLLMIIVSAKDPITAQPFNLYSNLSVNPQDQAAGGQVQQQLYLVDAQGNIEFPVLGKIQVGGKSREEIVADLKQQLSKYIVNPIINLRIMNYRITIKGEVRNPGTHVVTSERITLNEALALSGDLTIYGNRKNILVVREINGKRTSTRIDLTQADFINSPFYYLKQNDVVIVEPNKTQINSSAVGPNVQLALSGASILISLVIAIISLKK